MRDNDFRYCKGCAYLWQGYHAAKCCTYIIETGKRRPCEPGKGCTVKKAKKQARKEAAREKL